MFTRTLIIASALCSCACVHSCRFVFAVLMKLEEELALLVRLWSGVCDINKSHMPGCVATKSVAPQSEFWSMRCGVSGMAAKARASGARLVVCRHSGHKPQLLSPIIVAAAAGAILCACSHAQPLLVAAAASVVIEGVTDATATPDKHDLSDAGTMEALKIARIHCDSLCSSTKAYFARG